jgi:hypothetical protein
MLEEDFSTFRLDRLTDRSVAAAVLPLQWLAQNVVFQVASLFAHIGTAESDSSEIVEVRRDGLHRGSTLGVGPSVPRAQIMNALRDYVFGDRESATLRPTAQQVGGLVVFIVPLGESHRDSIFCLVSIKRRSDCALDGDDFFLRRLTMRHWVRPLVQ